MITLLLYCGMRAIPSWQFEVARLEGATSWNRLSTIVYPGVKHLLFFGGIFLFVDGVIAMVEATKIKVFSRDWINLPSLKALS